MYCPLFNTELFQKTDTVYYDCPECRALVMDKRFYLTTEQEKAQYETHINDVDDPRYQQFTSPLTKCITGNFNTAHTGLDFGCGSGPVIAKMLAEKGYSVHLYDPFYAPNTDVFLQTYDFIISCEVFEHFQNPADEISRLIGLLKPNGMIFIMTHLYRGEPDFSNWYYRRDPTHVFIYRDETIYYIAEKFKLSAEIHSERLITYKKRV